MRAIWISLFLLSLFGISNGQTVDQVGTTTDALVLDNVQFQQTGLDRRPPQQRTLRNYDPDEYVYIEHTDDQFIEQRSEGQRVWDHYRNRTPKKKDKVFNNESRTITSSSRSSGSSSQGSAGSGGNLITIIAFIILAVVVALIVYKLLSNRNPDAGKKVKITDITHDQNPEEIPKTALEAALEEAITIGNYRDAIRVYFIFIIKDLAEKNWIKWKKDKTNLAYLSEMAGRDEYNSFNSSVLFYEVIWYGKNAITQEEFNRVSPVFTNLLNKLNIR